MEASRNPIMVPSPRLEPWIPVDWQEVQRRLKKSQRQIDRARRRAEMLEIILYKSPISAYVLWYEQGGICPWCGQPITPWSGWSRHHIIPRSQGGSYALVNLQLLHPNCHQQLNQGLTPEQDCSGLKKKPEEWRVVA